MSADLEAYRAGLHNGYFDRSASESEKDAYWLGRLDRRRHGLEDGEEDKPVKLVESLREVYHGAPQGNNTPGY